MTNHNCTDCGPSLPKLETSSSMSSNNEYKLPEISAGEFWNNDCDTDSNDSVISLRDNFSRLGTGNTEPNDDFEDDKDFFDFEYRKNSYNGSLTIYDLKELIRNFEPRITPKRYIGFDGFLRFRHHLGKDYSCWPEWAFYFAGFLGETLPSFASKIREKCPTILLMDYLTPKYLKTVQHVSAEDAKFHLFLPFFETIDRKFDT